jgi:hypothetical protein
MGLDGLKSEPTHEANQPDQTLLNNLLSMVSLSFLTVLKHPQRDPRILKMTKSKIPKGRNQFEERPRMQVKTTRASHQKMKRIRKMVMAMAKTMTMAMAMARGRVVTTLADGSFFH